MNYQHQLLIIYSNVLGWFCDDKGQSSLYKTSDTLKELNTYYVLFKVKLKIT